MPLGVALRGHRNGIDENVENLKRDLGFKSQGASVQD